MPPLILCELYTGSCYSPHSSLATVPRAPDQGGSLPFSPGPWLLLRLLYEWFLVTRHNVVPLVYAMDSSEAPFALSTIATRLPRNRRPRFGKPWDHMGSKVCRGAKEHWIENQGLCSGCYLRERERERERDRRLTTSCRRDCPRYFTCRTSLISYQHDYQA